MTITQVADLSTEAKRHQTFNIDNIIYTVIEDKTTHELTVLRGVEKEIVIHIKDKTILYSETATRMVLFGF